MAPKYQVQIPGYSYTTTPLDIGKGYAEGITSAGQSIAGAISGIMGGIDPKTGESREGLLSQNTTANQFISTLGGIKDAAGKPYIDPETIDKMLSGNLASKQKYMGVISSLISSGITQQNALAQERLRQSGQIAAIGATGAQERETAKVTHPDLSLAPKVVNSQPGSTEDELRKKVNDEMQKRLAERENVGAFAMPPSF